MRQSENFQAVNGKCMANRHQRETAAKGSGAKPAAEDYLGHLGERIRRARARRGMTRKLLSRDSGISERYLAELEAGRGNASIVLLRQIAQAMDLALIDLVDEQSEPPVEFDLIVQRLRSLSVEELTELRQMVSERYDGGTGRQGRIALIGLRGAGKSSLGRRLADELDMPFIQINQEIERNAGMGLDEIFNLRGQPAYRRLERQFLDQVIEANARAIVETGGSMVSDARTFERLLSSCHTVWLRARPEDHMARVVAQGDSRPMAGNREAMADLKRILAGREGRYGKADHL